MLLGYDNDELKQMFEKNGYKGKTLKDNEAVELECLYSNSMDTSNISVPYRLHDNVAISPKENYENTQKKEQLLNFLTIMCFILCLGIAIVVMYSGYYMKIHIRRKEYAMLHTIGLQKRKIFRIIYTEIGASYIVASVFAIASIEYITKKFFWIKYPMEGNYFYHFPIKIFMITSVVVAFVTIVVVYEILRKMSKGLHVKALHEL